MAGLREAFELAGRFLEHRLPLMHAPGAALAVTDGDEMLGVIVRGFADAGAGKPVRPETRFQIGSISKSFAAIVALQESEAGRLDLHRPVGDYLPWLELREPFGRITMHHLLSHSSGLPLGTEESGEERFAVWRLRDTDPGFPPGERFHYSNDGYTLVGVVLQHVTGTPFPVLLRERIFEPLGMSATSGEITLEERAGTASGYQTLYDDRPAHRGHPLVQAPWPTSAAASGSIISNVLDMSAYARMLLARGAGPSGRIASADSFTLMTRPLLEDPDDPGTRYGYGLRTNEHDGRTYVGHSGSTVGYTALLLLDPDSGLAATMLVNGAAERNSTVRYALSAVRAALAGDPIPEVGAAPDPAAVPNAGEYAGRYKGMERAVELAAEEGRLMLREADVEVALETDSFQDPSDAFLVPHPAWDRFYLRFVRDDAGAVAEARHGPERLVREGSGRSVAPRPLPGDWEPFVGHYRSHNPWNASLRIVSRDGALACVIPWEAEESELVALGDGSFRVGAEEWRPSRIRFDTVIDGFATRALYDGAPMYRSFMP